ncbi:MAG: hypothetical protein QOF59_750 [Actinomycetota bacterium]|jgi:hypothetical protein|nr:hypothetical protein [Actinomycetota bacterium]
MMLIQGPHCGPPVLVERPVAVRFEHSASSGGRAGRECRYHLEAPARLSEDLSDHLSRCRRCHHEVERYRAIIVRFDERA